MDFFQNLFASGRSFRVLNIVREVRRECLALMHDTWIPGRRVVCELVTLDKQHELQNETLFLGLDHSRAKVTAWLDE